MFAIKNPYTICTVLKEDYSLTGVNALSAEQKPAVPFIPLFTVKKKE
jgi:hypothetical protein